MLSLVVTWNVSEVTIFIALGVLERPSDRTKDPMKDELTPESVRVAVT